MRLLIAAIALTGNLHAGVLYVPGNYCHQPDDNGHVPTNHLRLCFGNVPAEKVEVGVEKLAGVVKKFLGGSGTGDPPVSSLKRKDTGKLPVPQ